MSLVLQLGHRLISLFFPYFTISQNLQIVSLHNSHLTKQLLQKMFPHELHFENVRKTF